MSITGEIDHAPSWAPSWPRDRRAHGVILASHGALVTGSTVEEATYRSATFDRMCRLTY